MEILFLDQFGEVGGAQRVLLDLLPAVQRLGWRARVALPAGPLVEQLRVREIGVSEIPSGPYRSGRKGIADLVRFATRRQISADILDRTWHRLALERAGARVGYISPLPGRNEGGRLDGPVRDR